MCTISAKCVHAAMGDAHTLRQYMRLAVDVKSEISLEHGFNVGRHLALIMAVTNPALSLITLATLRCQLASTSI
jgi:hypothetical protein